MPNFSPWSMMDRDQPFLKIKACPLVQRLWIAMRLLLLILFFILTASVSGALENKEVVRHFSQSEFLLSDSTAPPPDTDLWQAQALPDNWDLSRPGIGGNAWYRIRFKRDSLPQTIQSIYIKRLNMNVAVWVNGHLVGSGGRFEEPVTRNWNRPQFYTFPPDLLKTGTNEIHLRLFVYPHIQGGLSSILLGPEETLRPEYESRFFLRITAGQTLNLMILSMGVLMLVLWCKRRKETVYGYFGLSSLAWGFITSNLYIKHIPVATPLWEALIHGAYTVFGVFLAFFALRYAEREWRVFERLLWGLVVVSPASLLLTGPDLFFRLSSFWHFLTLGSLAVIWVVLVMSVWKKRKSQALLLGGTGVLNLVLAAHDWLVHTAVLPYEELHLLQTGAHSLFFVIGWLLIDRFVKTLEDYEQLNQELETRVAEEHAEIEKSFVRLRTLEQEQAVLGERERIMRDMHDGMGARLMSGVHMVEQGDMNPGDVTDVLRECLDELRMMVDSLEPMENDLLTVMGNLRYRLEGRLKKQGIHLEWRVSDVPPLDCLTAQNILHVLRILQEMFTNILKHAKADTICVETEIKQPAGQAGHVVIHVHDNGVGLKLGRTGRGMKNMQKRAAIIGGAVEIKNNENGTLASLFLPFSEEVPSG